MLKVALLHAQCTLVKVLAVAATIDVNVMVVLAMAFFGSVWHSTP